MNLELDSLTVEGFRSFTNRQTFKFNGTGLYRVCGRNEVEARLGQNGAGKSSFFSHALTWVIYGKTASGLRNPDVSSWGGLGRTGITLKFSIDKKRHTLFRQIKPNALTLDNEAVSQEKVERVVGVPFEIFKQTIILGQGMPLFLDLSPADKLQLLSDALGLERWEKRSAFASLRTTTLGSELDRYQGELTGLQASVVELTDLHKKAKARADEWEVEQLTRLKGDKATLSAAQKDFERINKKYEKAQLDYDGAVTEIKALQVKTDEATKAYTKVTKDLMEQETLVSSALFRISELRQTVKSAERTNRCPTCGQVMKEEKAIEYYDKSQAEINELDKIINDSKTDKLKAAVKGVKSTLDRNEEAIKAFRELSYATRDTMDLLGPKVGELKGTIKALEAATSEGEAQENPHRKGVQELNRKIKLTEADLKECKFDIVRTSSTLERTKYWVKGFKDVRLYIIDEVLEELEIITNDYLEEVGLIGWQVNYAVEREGKSGTVQRGLNVTILSPGNKDWVRWEVWSGGEGQRLRLVTALSLSEALLQYAGMTTGIEVLDEPTRGLSREGVADLVAFLARRARQQGKQTYYIDHLAQPSTHFTDTITVTKTKDGSIIQ